MGVIPIRTTDGSFKIFIKNHKEVFGDIDERNDVQDILRKYLDESKEPEDEEVIYEYKLIPEIFMTF